MLTDKPVAIHRTDIYHRGERMALGPIANAVIKLWPLEGDRLVIGEGIETVLSAATRIKYRLPLRPAWAATVAPNIEQLPIVRQGRRW